MEYGVRYNLYMYIVVLAFTCTFEDVCTHIQYSVCHVHEV